MSDEVACRMLVLDSNACSCMRSLGMVGQARSAIVLAGVSRAEESWKICGGVRNTSDIALEYQGNNL